MHGQIITHQRPSLRLRKRSVSYKLVRPNAMGISSRDVTCDYADIDPVQVYHLVSPSRTQFAIFPDDELARKCIELL